MARLVTILAPVGALALAALLLVGIAGSLVRAPWQPPCVVDAPRQRVAMQGSVAEIAGQVAAALDTGAGTGIVAEGREGAVDAGALRAALRSGPVLTCSIDAIAATDTPKDLPIGLTPRARELRAAVLETFGEIPTGGYGAARVLPGRAAGGEHSLGRAIDFFFRPLDRAAQARRGWLLANWAVANAERWGIRTVIYRDHIWTARRSAQGWRDYRFSGSQPDSPVNRHLDHVHIDVA